MNIVAYNPGHDGAIAYLKDARLVASIEAEKNSKYRYSPISSPDVFNVLGELDEVPDVVCTGGWWPPDPYSPGSHVHVGYRGVSKSDIMVDQRRLLGKPVYYFSSSHERSHLLCAYGMSRSAMAALIATQSCCTVTLTTVYYCPRQQIIHSASTPSELPAQASSVRLMTA